MKLQTLSILCLPLMAAGCLSVSNATRETAKDGTVKVTHTRAFAWGDSRAAVGSVRNGIGTNFSGTASTGIDAGTSSSNAAPIIAAVVQGAIQAAVAAGVKSVVP